MNITLTLTATPELLNVLQNLTGFFSGSTAPVKEIKPAKKTAEAPKAEPSETPASTTATVATGNESISIEQVRKAVQAKSQDGKKDACKRLLSKYGVDKVTELPAEKYSDFLTEVNAL
jgi:hypothetical protein